MLGRTLNHYKILEPLGAGGMGEVFVAEDTRLHRKVALKVLPQHFADDPSRWARFEREAQAVAALSHPNIVTVYSVEEADGIRFITMELVPGRPLSEQIPKEGLPLDRFFELAVPIADAVAAAHRQGVIHRDLKPQNVVVGQDGRLRVLDFGLARFRDEGREGPPGSELLTRHLTGEGKIVGTVAYMPPEQLEGKPTDLRGDVFSLGVLLYEMATGQRPFKGDSAASVISSILRDTPASVTDLNPRLPRQLGRILRQCLAKDPEQRTQTAQDVRNQLLELRREVETGDVRPSATAPGGARAGRGPWLWVALGAGIALTLVSWYAVTRARPSPDGGGQDAVDGTFLQLTDQAGEELFPSLSKDGRTVAYASRAAGNWDIYVQRVAGSVAVNITGDSPANDMQPAFSPDGDRIAFRSDRDGGGVFVMGATGESVLRVSDFGSRPAWSPDGGRLAFETQNFEIPHARASDSEVWQVDLGTGERRKLSEGDAVQPAWSPHGHRIAYWGLTAGGQRDLFTIPAAGGPPVPVTQDPPLDWSPVWSNDGRFLYFSSERGGTMNLWRVAIDEMTGKTTGEPVAVTRGAAAESHSASVSGDGKRLAYITSVWFAGLRRESFDPALGKLAGDASWIVRGSGSVPVFVDVSPDGEWIAYYGEGARDTSGSRHEEVVVSRKDGSARRRVVGGPHRYRMPRWSPSGEEIAFFSDRGGKYDIWCVRPDGSGLRQVTADPERTILYPVWSPDGSKMAVSVRDGETLVIDPSRPWSEQTPEPLPLVEGGDLLLVPSSWSRDGRRLAGGLSRKDGAYVGQAFYDFQTKRYRKVTDRPGIPSWLSDGRRWLFCSGDGNQLFMLDTETGRITNVWRPTDGQIFSYGVAVSSDDRSVYFVQGERKSDLWLLDLK